MRVVGQEVVRLKVTVGEVAASTPGNADLFGQLCRMVDQQHTSAARTRGCGAHHACRPGTDHDHIELHTETIVFVATGECIRTMGSGEAPALRRDARFSGATFDHSLKTAVQPRQGHGACSSIAP
jgi:hypothetical protein